MHFRRIAFVTVLFAALFATAPLIAQTNDSPGGLELAYVLAEFDQKPTMQSYFAGIAQTVQYTQRICRPDSELPFTLHARAVAVLWCAEHKGNCEMPAPVVLPIILGTRWSCK